MKRFLAVLTVWLLMAGTASAAGSLWTKYGDRGIVPPYGYVYEFLTDDSNASVPTLTNRAIIGLLTAVDVEFDGMVPPTSVILNVLSPNGVTLLTTATLTGSTRTTLTTPIALSNGFNVTATIVGNAKKGKVIFYVL